MDTRHLFGYNAQSEPVTTVMDATARLLGAQSDEALGPSKFSLGALAGALGVTTKVGDYIGIYDLVDLVTDRPDPADPDTWDWTAALQEGLDLAVARRVPLVGRPGRYRATADRGLPVHHADAGAGRRGRGRRGVLRGGRHAGACRRRD